MSKIPKADPLPPKKKKEEMVMHPANAVVPSPFGRVFYFSGGGFDGQVICDSIWSRVSCRWSFDASTSSIY
jgi:hypothetical protein